MTAIAAGMKRAGISSPAIAARLGVSTKAVARKMTRVHAKRALDGKRGVLKHRAIAKGRLLQIDGRAQLDEIYEGE